LTDERYFKELCTLLKVLKETENEMEYGENVQHVAKVALACNNISIEQKFERLNEAIEQFTKNEECPVNL